MNRSELKNKLEELKMKQDRIDLAWRKTGNKELLQFFVDIIPKTLHSERCSIFVLDPVEDNIWVQCGTGLTEKQVCVPRDDSLVGKVISSGKLQVDLDMENQVGAHGLVDMQTGYSTRSAICVPVHGVSIDKITGAIQVLNKLSGKNFDEEDKEILEKLAFHLQMNIENIFLRQEILKLSEKMGKTIDVLEKKLQRVGSSALS